MSEMRITIQKTEVGVNMGDHAQDVIRMHEVAPGETVEGLANRLLNRMEWKSVVDGTVPEPDYSSFLVIRLAEPRKDENNEPF